VLPHVIQFEPAEYLKQFDAVPAKPAVFVLRGHSADAEPYVSKTANLRRRLLRLLSPPEERSKRLNLRDRVRTIEYALTGSDFESGLVLYKTLRAEFPKTYANRLRWRPAPLVRLILENAYPRATVTTRITTLRGRSIYYGPFPTRAAAEKVLSDSLDFFKLRRCTDDLHPDPAFPGCIYSEMKMCLAPCFRGCADEEYAGEAERVQAFFDSGGRSLRREFEAERDQASTNLEFEQAASVHARLEKLAPVLALWPEIIHRIDQLNGLMIQPSAEAGCVSLFRIEAGRLNGPIPFSVQQSAEAIAAAQEKHGKPLSMEARMIETLAAVPPLPPGPALETTEQLAYLKRWYYRSSKIGEAFFTDEKGECRCVASCAESRAFSAAKLRQAT
jgi:excinuclease UvrABC nuclease subunit